MTWMDVTLEIDPRNALIMSLADKLYICSRLLTAASEKLGWDNAVVQDLIHKLKQSVEEDTSDASI